MSLSALYILFKPIQRSAPLGHFYHAINVNHPELAEDWEKIDKIHDEFHAIGDKVVASVKNNDKISSRKIFERNNCAIRENDEYS